jgi:hypothetical protein
MYNWTRPGGCKELAIICQDALKDRYAIPPGKNWPSSCDGLAEECSSGGATELYRTDYDHGWLDITHQRADPFPAPHMYGYLTEESVLSALGVPVNYSETSSAVSTQFQNTLDILSGGYLDSVAYLLDSGIKVHMMYGDRDYAGNWIGGELASLAIPYSRQDEFKETGYAPLLTSDGVSGMTRQLGNFSFTRVFQAGHEVPSYQPEAAYEIFMRATLGRDIPTGLLAVTDDFHTVGMKDTWSIKNVPPEVPESRCYVLKPDTCTPEAWESVTNGTAVVEDWFVVGQVKKGERGVGLGWSENEQEVMS